MDRPLTPPPRIQVISTISTSTKTTLKLLETFLDDFQARSTSAQGGNTAVTVQLQKLVDALKEERVKKRKDKIDNHHTTTEVKEERVKKRKAKIGNL